MDTDAIFRLIGSIGFPGAILILLIFLANKHLPGLIKHFQGIETEISTLSSSINRLIHRIDNKLK